MNPPSPPTDPPVSGRVRVFDSLSFRLGMIVTVSILATALLVAAGVVWRTVEREAEARGVEIRATAQALSASLSEAVAERAEQDIYDGLRTLQYVPSVSFAEVRAGTGRRLAQVGHQAVLVGGDREDSLVARVGQLLRSRTLSETVEIRYRGEAVGTLMLAGETPGARPALMKELASLAKWAGLAVLIGFIVAYRQQRRITRPLRALAEVMGRPPENGDLPARAPAGGIGEVGVLVGSYNAMIEQIMARDRIIADHRTHLESKVDQRTRELRVARDKAEAATEAKSRFLATMSHEIRTPMNGVLVMAELLERSPLETAQRSYANVIAHSGRSLMTLLNDILDFSKMEAGHVELERLPMSIDALVSEVAMLFWEQARTKDLALVRFVAADVPETIKGDPTRLRQCLANLIGNALKFTATGHVAVDVTCGPEGCLLISVSDTGAGIPEDRQAAIFGAFEQSDRSTTRTHGGTGLGLAIVSRLVEAMEGRVTVESVVGEGSRFTIAMPFEPIASAVPVPLSHSPRIAFGRGVHPAFRERIARTLSSAGAQIVAQAEDADCILAGSDAPDKPEIGGVPVVGLWTFGTPEPRAQLEDGRIRDVLRLPATRADMRVLVERVASGNFRGAEALAPVAGGHGADDTRFAHLRVLVADDDAVNRQVIGDALAAFGIEPRIVEDGAQAVAAATDGSFDVILLDGMMPVMDGRMAARRLRENGTEGEIVLFSATASGEDGDGDLFDSVLPKPFALDDLERLLSSQDVVPPEKTVAASEIPPSPSQSEMIDFGVFGTLRALDAKRLGALKRIVDQLLETLPVKVADLETAFASGDPEKVRRAAHSLKSVAGSAGGGALTELAADLEMEAIEAQEFTREIAMDGEKLSRVRNISERTIGEIKTMMASGR